MIISHKEEIRGSFIHGHMVVALTIQNQKPEKWTPRMYAVYNDCSDETTEALIELWNEPNHGLPEGKE